MLGLLHQESEALQVIDFALKVDLVLGAALAGKVKLVFQQKTTNLVINRQIYPLFKAELLGSTSSSTAVLALCKLIQNESSYVRWRVAKALGKIGGETAVITLGEVLYDKSLSIRQAVVSALAEIGDDLAISILRKALTHSHLHICRSAAYALAEISDETALPLLIQDLDNQDLTIRRDAAEALGGIPIDLVVNALSKVLDDEDYFVQEASIYALAQIGKPSAKDVLVRALTHKDNFVRVTASEALEAFGDEVALATLANAQYDEMYLNRNKGGYKYIRHLIRDTDEIDLVKINQALEKQDFFGYEGILDGLTEFSQPKLLPLLQETLLVKDQIELVHVVLGIQNRCGFYNYEIAQAAVEEGKREKEAFTESSITSNDELYADILTTIFNSGRNIESSPKEIRRLDEESLRHILIHAINAKYSNVAEAEAYNKGGKTDILVRINGEKVLIAECKIWHGEDSLAKALDQLLQRYVTWRDTKLALLIFSRNQKISDVVQKIPQEIKQHRYFVREGDSDSGKAWFRFVVSHPDDRDRELTLTVLAFDIPS